MYRLAVETEEGEKGRTFAGVLLAWIVADKLWSRGSSDTLRPAWALIAISDQEAAPFVANMRLGKKCRAFGDPFDRKGSIVEWTRSGDHFYPTPQRHAEGVLVNPMQRQLFWIDPGPVTGSIEFICMPTAARLEREIEGLGSEAEQAREHLRRFHGAVMRDEDLRVAPAMALLFGAMLLSRSSVPIPTDLRFLTQLYVAALAVGLASFPGHGLNLYQEKRFGFHEGFKFTATHVEDYGYATPVAMNTDHELLESFLSQQVLLFDAMTRKPSATKISILTVPVRPSRAERKDAAETHGQA